MSGPALRQSAVVDLLAEEERAVHVRELASRLGLQEGREEGLRDLLDRLVTEGVLTRLGQRYRMVRGARAPRFVEITGTLSVNPRGFGFVSVVGGDDVWIPPEAMGGAMHGDSVVARVVARGAQGPSGEIVRIVSRRGGRVAGVVRVRGKSQWLEPDDARIRGPIVLARSPDAREGAAGVAQVTRFPEHPDENPEGELIALLGTPGEPQVEVAKILLVAGVDEEHPEEATAEALAFGREIAPADLVGLEDLTHLPLPTIDPEDARDHDDAVWVTRDERGHYRATIAIADVSRYVRPGTALDEAALARGNSTYLPDRSIPMLPRALSSHLCSLLPDELRLCMAVEIDLDPAGSIESYRVFEGFMRSAAKLTYQGVARALGFTALPPRDPAAEALRHDLQVIDDLARVLRVKRLRRGALVFDLPEAHVEVDAEGLPISVEQRAHDPGVAKAYRIVEELMLLANETVARFLGERELPTIHRVHGPPDPERLARFAAACEALDLAFDVEDAQDPKKLSSFLKRVAAHPQKDVLHGLLLRAMKQAVYDVTNIGHFGLASPAYLHFTSPIRRYADLVVHRTVRAVLRGERVDTSERAIEGLRAAAAAASSKERLSMTVERDVVDLYRAIYMREHLGEELEGTVSAIVGSGLFVAIPSPFIDVMVRFEALGPEGYASDDDGLAVFAARSGERIGLGDPMRVLVEDVSIQRRQVLGRRVRRVVLDAPEGRARKVRARKETQGKAAPGKAPRGGPAAGGKRRRK